MPIIDSHAHIFTELCGFGADGELRSIGGGKARWATGEVIDLIPQSYGDTTFSAERFLTLMDQNNVEKAVLLQGGFLGFANDYLSQVVSTYPTRFAASATFDPFCRNAQKILDNLIQTFRIFKFEMSTGCGIMGSHPDFPLDNPSMMQFYEQIASKKGVLVFDLGSPGDGSNQPHAIRNIAEAFPHMPIVICHLMSPRRNHRRELEEGLKTMNRENIYFDLAALHHKVRPENYPFPTAQEFISLAKNLVGPDHLMWGTDVPSTLVQYSYRQLLDYQWELFTEEERKMVFHDTAERIYFST
ncbi:MAG: amidohydrolase family protein [Sphaerochaeta sp.]|nr:amidohydrolase family protein [Sphaerochaeta sp.]